VAKGGLAGPVQLGAAWHLLMLTDTRTETVGQSGAMREQLRQAAMREQVTKKVREYLMSLRETYGVVVNDSLLASLDYGSADSTLQAEFKVRTDVLAVLPWRSIEVRELTRRIKFQHFHGIQGKPDAAQIRDKVFEDWVAELLLRHETEARGFDKRPDILAAADELERDLIREFMAKKFLDVSFEPPPEEIARYWKEHPATFTPAPRVQADGVLLADEASAQRFRDQIDAGAKLRWLADRTPEIRDPKPALFAGWIAPAVLGLAPSELTAGRVVGPFPSGDAWAVATVVSVETVAPTPLDQCTPKVVAAMKRDRTHEAITEALARLESAATIRVAADARETVATRVDEWLGRTPAPAIEPDPPVVSGEVEP
jgi:peptidylprolyl isomerase